MRFTLTGRQFLEQIPNRMKLLLIAEELVPETITFDTEHIQISEKQRLFEEPALANYIKYPDLFFLQFTNIEEMIMDMLIGGGKDGVYVENLYKIGSGYETRAEERSNTVNVHIKNIRKKIFNTGWEIQTKRGSGGRSTRFIISIPKK